MNAPADLTERIRRHPPATLVTEWFPRLGLHGGVALDLGSGSGAEAEYLARQGMMVDAIDRSPAMVKVARDRCRGLTVDVIEGDFLGFELRPSHYALAVAINALPFVAKEACGALLRSVQESLRPGGVALLTVFGPEHAWASRQDMSFWTLEEFRALWAGWETLALEEVRGTVPLVSGTEVFQHRIQVIARKPA